MASQVSSKHHRIEVHRIEYHQVGSWVCSTRVLSIKGKGADWIVMLANNGGTWAFGAGNAPLSSGILPAPRQWNMMSSFAQTISASSQSSAQLDPS